MSEIVWNTPMKRDDCPDRLIPGMPNDVLLSLVQNCNIGIEARIKPSGCEYFKIKFWADGSDKSISVVWRP